MVGIDIADTIVIRRTVEKGTRVIEEPIKKSKFAGAEFKKYEMSRRKLAGNIGLASAKGTATVRLAKLVQTEIPSTKGILMSTGKGTGIRMG